MKHLESDAITGVNNFIEDQKKSNVDANVTLVLFDDQYEVVYDRISIDKVEPLTSEKYFARGWTALNDSIGKSVTNFKSLREADKIDAAVVCILTDGLENASKEYSSEQIKKLLKECEDNYKWNITYLAANQDAFAVGGGLGFAQGNVANFAASSAGLEKAFRSMSTRSVDYSTHYLNNTLNSAKYTNMQDLVDDKKGS